MVVLVPTSSSSTSAHDAWTLSEKRLSPLSKTHLRTLRDQLRTLKKDSEKPMSEYLLHAKSIADSLNVAGSAITEDELIECLLDGLGPEYKEFTTAIHLRPSLSYDDCYDLLIQEENLVKKMSSLSLSSGVALAASRRSAGVSNNNSSSSQRSFGHGHGRGRDRPRGQWQPRSAKSWVGGLYIFCISFLYSLYLFPCLIFILGFPLSGMWFVCQILMASGIPGSTSKGKDKIPISSSSCKGGGGGDDGVPPAAGGGGDGVPPGGSGGDGVTPGGGGGDGVPPGGGGGGGAVGGRERRMVDILRRVRRTGQREEEELLMSINIMSTSFGQFQGILRDFIRVLNMPENTSREYWCGHELYSQAWISTYMAIGEARDRLSRVVLDRAGARYLRVFDRDATTGEFVLLFELRRSELGGMTALENKFQARIGELYLGLVDVDDYELCFVSGAHTWSKSLFVDQIRVRGWQPALRDLERVVLQFV